MSKEEKDSMVTSWAALALHDGDADVTSDQLKTLIEATGNEGVFGVLMVGGGGEMEVTLMVMAKD